jgi:hypothetical protein
MDCPMPLSDRDPQKRKRRAALLRSEPEVTLPRGNLDPNRSRLVRRVTDAQSDGLFAAGPITPFVS